MKCKLHAPFVALACILILWTTNLNAQQQNVGIGTTTPDESAILDITSNEKGVLIPRVSEAQRLAIASPADGLLVFDTDAGSFYFYQGGEWKDLSPNSNIVKDSDGDTRIETEHSADDDSIRFFVKGNQIALLDDKHFGLEAPGQSLFIGKDAGLNDDGSANKNIAIGNSALHSNVSGELNTAIGYHAGYTSTGNSNVLIGNRAGYHEAGSNKLFIDNSDTPDPLIWGDFGSDSLKVNGSLEVDGESSINGNLHLPESHCVYIGGITNDGEDGLRLHAGVTNGYLDHKGAGKFHFRVDNINGGLTRMAIDGITGNVGIGTTTPEEKLHVNGNLKVGGTTRVNDDLFLPTAKSIYVGGNTPTGEDGVRIHQATSNGFIDHKGSGALHFRADNSNGSATRMTIDGGTGNVGIGTTSPSEKLHVNGNLYVHNGNIATNSGNLSVGNTSSLFGNVGIGSPSSAEKLYVNGNQKLDGSLYVGGNTDLGEDGVRYRYASSNGSIDFKGTGDFTLNTNSINGIRIRPDGTVYLNNMIATQGAVFWGPVHLDNDTRAPGLPYGDHENMQYEADDGKFYYDNSSRRYKRNIRKLKDDFSLILQAEPKTYTRPDNPNRWEVGYIAEEMDSLGLTTLVSFDREGIPSGFNYEKMILYVTEILKVQDQNIRSLKADNKALEERIRSLEEQLKGEF